MVIHVEPDTRLSCDSHSVGSPVLVGGGGVLQDMKQVSCIQKLNQKRIQVTNCTCLEYELLWDVADMVSSAR